MGKLSEGETTIKLSELTPCWLKDNYLTGLKIVDGQGRDYPDTFFETHMQNAMRYIEETCDITVIEVSVKNEQHDYRVTDYAVYGFMQLFKVPLRAVKQVRAVYPLGQNIAVYPDEWIQPQGYSGQIHIIPSRGSLGSVIIGQGGDFIPLIYGGLSYLPSLWEVDYVAGFDPENLPRMVVDAWAKLTAMNILTILSDLVRPIGVSSTSASIDGMSQSMSYQLPAFQARLSRYSQDLYGPDGKQQQLAMTSGLLKQIYDVYRPQNMASLY